MNTHRLTLVGMIATLLLLPACTHRNESAPHGSTSTASSARLFDGLGDHRRSTSLEADLAQRYFDQGLIWAYAFNHDEAIRSFSKAAELDPRSPAPWWGIALCNGPHINNPVVDEAHAKAAWEALQKARERRSAGTATEQDLIDALAHRYAWPQPADRRPLDLAYAQAMQKVRRKHPSDADVATLCAEAMMNLQPWDFWTPDDQPKGSTSEIIAILDDAVRLDADHPGAHHLMIHICEAGPSPRKALRSADLLRTAVPASGHLVHMPSHIDIRVGEWELAALQNEQAIEADRTYQKRSPHQGFYRVYMAHNRHFLAFACMMNGRSKDALRSARQMVAGIPAEFVAATPALMDPFFGTPIDVMIRFGMWDEILAEPAPDATLKFSTAMRRFARGVAYAARKDVAAARAERELLRTAYDAVPPEQFVSINKARHVLDIASAMLDGEILFAAGDSEGAIARLRAAVEIEDRLLYMEPPEWLHPVRQPLGAVLLAAGRTAEAEDVYRKDLEYWPENGWSLFGLAECLEARKATVEAAEVRRRFDKTWRRADVTIGSSCLCVPSSGGRAAVDSTTPIVAGTDATCTLPAGLATK